MTEIVFPESPIPPTRTLPRTMIIMAKEKMGNYSIFLYL